MSKSMIKRMIFMVLVLAMVFVGCTPKKSGSEDKTSSVEPPVSTPDESETPEQSQTNPETDKTRKEIIEEQIAGLKKDLYPELELSAAILERKAILQGDVFRIKVEIKNAGTKDITLPFGSGSNDVPDALKIYIDGIQIIPQKSEIGPATMDMQTKDLPAGESLSYDYYAVAIKESADFSSVFTQLYVNEQKYVGEMTAEEIAKAYPELELSDKGSYVGKVFLMYFAPEDGEEYDFTTGANGYAEAEFGVGIS